MCVNIASSPWIGHRESRASTVDNTTTTTTFLHNYQPSSCIGSPGKVVDQMTTHG